MYHWEKGGGGFAMYALWSFLGVIVFNTSDISLGKTERKKICLLSFLVNGNGLQKLY